MVEGPQGERGKGKRQTTMTKARCRASRPRKRAVTFPPVARATVGKIPGGSRRRLERQARGGVKKKRRPEIGAAAIKASSLKP